MDELVAATNALRAAEEWRSKGDPRWEVTCLSQALTSFLSAAVGQEQDGLTGRGALAKWGAGEIVVRLAALNEELLARIDSGSGAVDRAVAVPVHVAWLTGEWSAATILLGVASAPKAAERFPLSPFWSEYQRGLQALASGAAYLERLIPTKGYEKYWRPYLLFASALSTGADVSVASRAIADSFAKRNRDARLIDWLMIDGDGKHPVRWDFREFSMLLVSEHSRKRRITIG
jgi:hypothetical protein